MEVMDAWLNAEGIHKHPACSRVMNQPSNKNSLGFPNRFYNCKLICSRGATMNRDGKARVPYTGWAKKWEYETCV